MPVVVILRAFIAWLQEQRPELTQSEVGRRARVSQSFVSKLMRGSAVRDPTVESHRQILGTFALDWVRFLAAHPTITTELERQYEWLRPVFGVDRPDLTRVVSALEETVQRLESRLGRHDGDATSGPPDRPRTRADPRRAAGAAARPARSTRG